jgi:hypothetical protein
MTDTRRQKSSHFVTRTLSQCRSIDELPEFPRFIQTPDAISIARRPPTPRPCSEYAIPVGLMLSWNATRPVRALQRVEDQGPKLRRYQ